MDNLNARVIESAARMIEFNDKQIELMQRLDNQSMSRIVWFVAIAGFSLINVPAAASFAGASARVPTILVAWLVTAFLGAFAHWQFRNRSVATIHVYLTRRELLMAFLANGPEMATLGELKDIVNNVKDPLPKLFRSQIAAVKFADRLELLMMIAFVVSMALTALAFFDVARA
jgi:hypothetical protein